MQALRCAVAALSLLLVESCGGASPSGPTATAAPAQIWIQPRPEMAASSGIPAGGSSDFDSLFSGTQNWRSSAAHTAVFGLYAGWVANIDGPTLANAVNFTNAHHISIELESPSLQATAACGSGVEGYAPYGQSLTVFTNQYLARLKALGANVGYIKVDEPYFFGSVVADPRSCHWSAAQVAQDVAQFVQLVHATYPNAQVGDVEPIVAGPYPGGPASALQSWHDAFAAAMGTPFPFFIADMDFSNASWPALALQMQQAMRARGERFGIIFIGDPTDTSDAVWSQKTLARFQTFASTSGSAPNFVFFQSWDPYPQYALPESDSTTFTGVVKAYIDSPNTFTAKAVAPP